MRIRVELFLRAFAVVTCTATNVVLISRGHWVGMAFTGYAISALWWWNARSAAHSRNWLDGVAYASGASLGTVAGAALGRLL